VLPERLHFSS